MQLRLEDSRAFPGTSRTVHVHAPSGPDPGVPLRVCVFLDGSMYLDPGGPVRGGAVLDDLHHRGLVPPTVGVFVDPGTVPGEDPDASPRQRNREYDPFTPLHGAFLREEVLPLVEDEAGLDLSTSDVVVCGGSSGGNGAFAAAWHHPDVFAAAICFVPSFAQVTGGDPVPRALASDDCPERLRVFLQIGLRDLNWDRPEHNWAATNLRVAAELLEHGHDLRCVVGDGGHNPDHGAAILPDALVWALDP